MTPYDLLRRLAQDSNWQEGLKRDAKACVDEMEKLRVLGDLAATIDTQDHAHVPEVFQAYDPGTELWHRIETCRVCKLELSDTVLQTTTPWGVTTPKWSMQA